MQGRLEDIDVVAVEHPFNGLCIMGHQFGGREACEFETFIPVDSDVQAIAAALVRIHALVHPKNLPVTPPAPQRKRPSAPEAFAALPDLLRQFYSSLDEMSFLFRRSLIPEGEMGDRLGEIVAAYVYDLDLNQEDEECAEAKTSDGRCVQVQTTRASGRGTVALRHTFEHLLVVRLTGRQLIEVYNGPLEPIWAVAKRIQRDGTRRVSMSRLHWHNDHVVPPEEKLPRIRSWKSDETPAI